MGVTHCGQCSTTDGIGSTAPVIVETDSAIRETANIVLVQRGLQKRICRLQHIDRLELGEHDVPLTLISHPGLAIVPAMDEAFSTGPVSYVPVRIGNHEKAIRVTFDGTCMWRTLDEKILCPYAGGYHEGNAILLSSSQAGKRMKKVLFSANGAVSHAAAPDLVWGLEEIGCGVEGQWRSEQDGVEVMTSNELGIFESNDRTRGSLTKVSGNQVLLRYELGESFLYTLTDTNDLAESDGYVVWKWIGIRERRPSRDSIMTGCNSYQRKGFEKACDMIGGGFIALVRGAYLESCFESGKPYEMRQQIPAECFWDPVEALSLWDVHGRAFLLIWSYGWLTPQHPDPDGYHLAQFYPILQKFKSYSSKLGVKDIAVVIDYCALWQKDGEPDQRTELQKGQFAEGLSGFTDLYVHPDITAVKLRAMPQNEPRRYDDRGWTLAEYILIDSKAGVGNRLSFDESFCASAEFAEGWAFLHKHGNKRSNPPLTPEDFEMKLEKRRQRVTSKGLKLFASQGDMTIVPQMYRTSFRCLLELDAFSFPMSEWLDDDVRVLCKTLERATKLKKLNLSHNSIGNDGARVLCDTLLKTKQLKRLQLDYNSIGTTGVESVVSFFREHSSLRCLTLNHNPFCKLSEIVQGVKDAWASAGKDIRLLRI